MCEGFARLKFKKYRNFKGIQGYLGLFFTAEAQRSRRVAEYNSSRRDRGRVGSGSIFAGFSQI
jgi:hypothetical protein